MEGFVGVAIGVAALLGAAGGVAALFFMVLKPRTAPADGLLERITALELQVKELPEIWERSAERAEEAKAHADRVWSRTRAAESRRRRLESEQLDDDAEEDGDQLRLGDGASSEATGVLPLRAAVEVPPAEPDPLIDPYILAGLR